MPTIHSMSKFSESKIRHSSLHTLKEEAEDNASSKKGGSPAAKLVEQEVEEPSVVI